MMKLIYSLKQLCAPAIASLLAFHASFAGSVVKSPDPKAAAIEQLHPMYLGSLNTGVKGNDAYVDGNFSIVAPVWSTLGSDAILSGGALFLEPYISWGEGGEVATSLGLGYRYLIGDQPLTALTKHDGHQAGFFEEGIAIGGNLFLDMMDTEADNQFWQLGVGLEVATRYVELSGNYYIPLSDKQLAEETRTTETFTTSTTRMSQSVTPSAPYAQGNTIAQDATLTTFATTTTRTTTIERLFQRFEEGMEGWDAQIGVLIPGLDRYLDVKIIGGYYSFDNQPYGPQEGGTGKVEGWKAGLEVRPVPALVLSGTWYEDKRLTGDDWTVGVQMQIPFEAGNLGDGKGFWGRIKDSFTPRRRHLIERLAEPVHRQNAAVKIANSVKAQAKSDTNVQRSTRVVSSSTTHLVLADDVVFVNNGDPVNGIQTGSVAGTGTAEQPVDTIQQGSTLAQNNSNSTGRVWSVYTQGTVAGYNGDVIAETGSVNFIGSGSSISGVGATNFGSGPAPVLTGGFLARNIGTFGVTGYTIIGGLPVPLNTGIYLETTSSVALTATLNNNTITGTNIGINVFNSHADSIINLIASNNTITGGSFGIYAPLSSNSTVNLTLSNNIISGGSEGVYAYSFFTGSTLNVTASNNIITGGIEGISAQSYDGAVLNFTASNNTITGGSIGIFIYTHLPGAVLNFTAVNNTITGRDQGIYAEYLNGSTLNLTASQNTITDGNYGIYLSNYYGDHFSATLDGNRISNPLNSGIFVNGISTMDINGTVNNIVTGSGGFSLEVSGNPTGSIILNGVPINPLITTP